MAISSALAAGVSPETRIRPAPVRRWGTARAKAGNFSTSANSSRTKGRSIQFILAVCNDSAAAPTGLGCSSRRTRHRSAGSRACSAVVRSRFARQRTELITFVLPGLPHAGAVAHDLRRGCTLFCPLCGLVCLLAEAARQQSAQDRGHEYVGQVAIEMGFGSHWLFS